MRRLDARRCAGKTADFQEAAPSCRCLGSAFSRTRSGPAQRLQKGKAIVMWFACKSASTLTWIAAPAGAAAAGKSCLQGKPLRRSGSFHFCYNTPQFELNVASAGYFSPPLFLRLRHFQTASIKPAIVPRLSCTIRCWHLLKKTKQNKNKNH